MNFNFQLDFYFCDLEYNKKLKKKISKRVSFQTKKDEIYKHNNLKSTSMNEINLLEVIIETYQEG